MAEAFVLDKASIMERLGGDEEIYAMMIDMYLQDVDNNCAALDKAIHSGDAELIRREAHTMKGLLATFSDNAGAADAHHIEMQARAGHLAGLNEAIQALVARMREVAGVLNATVG